jgi:hypothetical protein
MSRCWLWCAGEAGERSLKNTLQQFANEFLVASKAGNLLESKLVMSHYDSTGTNSSELHAKKKGNLTMTIEVVSTQRKWF